MHPSMFQDHQWQVMMFWYAVLTTIGGGFLLLTIVKSGYKYMHSALNPGIRVSFIEDTQRAVIAMTLVVLTPVFITLLTEINDSFVWLFGKILNHFVDAPQLKATTMDKAEGLFENIIAAPFNTIITIFDKTLGLKDLDKLIFNGQTKIFGSSLLKTVDTGNPLANVFFNGSLVAFNVYFNAVYTIRMWVVTANLVATPIIVWVWVITAERQVLEIWLAEIIQTIFMQSAHAFSLGIFTSIAAATGSVTGKIDTGWFSSGMIQIGVYFAGFGGSICVAILVVLGIRLILARNSEERSKAKEGLIKTFIGLVILGMCITIASFLAVLLSGNWGVKL